MRKSLIGTLVFFSMFAALQTAVLAQGVELHSGQKLTGEFDEPTDDVIFRIQAVKGDLLTLKMSASKKSDLDPVVVLIGPAGEIDLPAPANGKITLKKKLLPATGTYLLFVSAAGTTGEFKIALKIKGAKVPPADVTVPGEFTFEAPRGASVSASVKAAKGTDLEPGVDALKDTLGTDHLDELLLKEKGKSAKLKKHPVMTFGKQTMVLAARGGAGGATVKLRVKPGKPRERKLTRGTMVRTVLLKLRAPADGGGFDYALIAEVEGDDVTSAKLVYPDGTEKTIPEEETGYFDLEIETDDEADIPDGLYKLVATRTGGVTHECPILVGGAWPTAVEVTDAGTGATPTVRWTGGTGAQAVFLSVRDVIDDDEVYGILLPGGTTSHQVPDGPLDAMRPYEVEVYALSAGHKVAVAGETSGGGIDLDVTDTDVALVHATNEDWHNPTFYGLEVTLEGTGIRAARIEFPSGHTEDLSLEGGAWRFRSRAGRMTDFEQGTYTFAIDPIAGVTDRTHTFEVGGVMPDWSQAGFADLNPSHLTGTGTTTPTITWPDLSWAGGYRLEIHDKDDEVVHEQGFDQFTTSHMVPAGVLSADSWYTVYVSVSNGQGMVAALYSTIYTGTGLNWLGFELDKMRGSIGGGAPVYAVDTCVWSDGPAGLAVTGARVLDQDGTPVIVMAKDGDEYCFTTDIATEATVNATLPDGFYRVEVTFANGSVCTGIFTWVGGEWPDWLGITAPADGAVGVSRTPELSWTFGDLTHVSFVEASYYDSNTDADYAFMWGRDSSVTSIAWADLDEKEVTQLPKNKEIEVDLMAGNGHNKKTITVTSFTTGN